MQAEGELFVLGCGVLVQRLDDLKESMTQNVKIVIFIQTKYATIKL